MALPPLIIRHPGGAQDVINGTPVSLVDVTATLADAVGLDIPESWRGTSLLKIRNGDAPAERLALSEYHGHGASHGMFMLRQGRYKYVYYPHNPPQLFDLETDARELRNLAGKPGYAGIVRSLHRYLLKITDPDTVDTRALADQAQRLEASIDAWR